MKIRNLKTLKDARGNPGNYFVNFLRNMARAAILISLGMRQARYVSAGEGISDHYCPVSKIPRRWA